MVSLGDAAADPWAMMVVYRNTAITNTAVIDSRSFHYVAGWTFFALDFVLVLLLLLLFLRTFGDAQNVGFVCKLLIYNWLTELLLQFIRTIHLLDLNLHLATFMLHLIFPRHRFRLLFNE